MFRASAAVGGVPTGPTPGGASCGAGRTVMVPSGSDVPQPAPTSRQTPGPHRTSAWTRPATGHWRDGFPSASVHGPSFPQPLSFSRPCLRRLCHCNGAGSTRECGRAHTSPPRSAGQSPLPPQPPLDSRWSSPRTGTAPGRVAVRVPPASGTAKAPRQRNMPAPVPHPRDKSTSPRSAARWSVSQQQMGWAAPRVQETLRSAWCSFLARALLRGLPLLTDRHRIRASSWGRIPHAAAASHR